MVLVDLADIHKLMIKSQLSDMGNKIELFKLIFL